MNLVELITDPIYFKQAPCKHGNIVAGHACYCHNAMEDMPRKCPIWRNGHEWSDENCTGFEEVKHD